MAMGDRGLALPRELSVCFPEPPDFSAGAFHNRSAHTQSIHERRSGASGRRGLSPLSTGTSGGTAGSTWPFRLAADIAYTAVPTRGIAPRGYVRAFSAGRDHACRWQPAWRPHDQSRVGCGLDRVRGVLVLGAGALGIPGVLLVRFADKGGGSQTMPQRRGACRRRELHRQGCRGRPRRKSRRLPKNRQSLHRLRPSRRRAAPRWPCRHSAEALGARRSPKQTRLIRTRRRPLPRTQAGRKFALGCGRARAVRSPDGAASATPRLRCPRRARRQRRAAPALPIALPRRARSRLGSRPRRPRSRARSGARPLYHFEFWLEPPDEVKRSAGRRRLRVQHARGHAAVASVERAEDRLPHLRRRPHLRRQGHGHAEIQGRPLAAGRRRRLPAGD